MHGSRSALAATIILLAIWPAPGLAAVLFQNGGAKAGWTSLGIQHIGKIDEVAMPTFAGPTALRMEQTFEGLSGYHSEVRLHEAQGPMGSEVYYGMALYLPPNWVFHNQNVTFQQWARGDVFASPWVLMYVENDEIKTGGSGGIRGVIAKITGMQGKWIRVVTHLRHHPTNGLFEVWVNGVKGLSFTGDVSPAAGAPIRWSAGIYCTRWREEQPRGLNPMVVFQDQYRVATTMAEADPMSWMDGVGPSVPEDGGASLPDAGPDLGVLNPAPTSDAAPVAVSGDAAPVAVPRDAAPDRARSVATDAGAAPPEEPVEPVPPSHKASGGCSVGSDPGAQGWTLLAAVLLALGPSARNRNRRRDLAAKPGKGTLNAGDASPARR
jgi:MYXO-CTERM domain-containing protein